MSSDGAITKQNAVVTLVLQPQLREETMPKDAHTMCLPGLLSPMSYHQNSLTDGSGQATTPYKP